MGFADIGRSSFHSARFDFSNERSVAGFFGKTETLGLVKSTSLAILMKLNLNFN